MEEKYELHRLLATVFSQKLTLNEKVKIMESEYAIQSEKELEEEVNAMCNLGAWVRECAEKEAKEKAEKEVKEKVEGILKEMVLI